MPDLSRARPRRTPWVVAVLAAVAVVLGVVVALDVVRLSGGSDDEPADGVLTSSTQPWFGLLEADVPELTTLDPAGAVTDVAVAASWAALEPTVAALDPAAVAQLAGRIRAVSARGYRVVLDLGLQYPPSWVFALPGQTRFVDQYGDAWHGTSSTDVPNSVFNPHVRAAVGTYLARLGRALHSAPVSRIRIGGLLSGELRYPPATFAGHANLLWNYDDAARAGSPVPGWRPGVGTAADARTGLAHYFDSLTAYLVWMMRTTRAAFPGGRQEVLFPSWGLRPGMVDEAIAAGLRGTTNAEVNGMISSGLDWTAQVAAIARTGIQAYLSSTWLDAPQQGSSVRQIPPIAYLSELAAPHRLGVTGENTGRGGTAALDLSVERVRRYRLVGMMYMSGRLVATGRAGVTPAQLGVAATEVRRP